MTTAKPTIVIIHGGWHVPESYEKLISALRNADYEVHCPRLPTTNLSRPPNADLYTDSDLVRTYVSSLVEAGRNVVVLLHSYGGQVGSNALVGLGQETRAKEGLSGGVSHLIYLSGFALSEGVTMMEKVEEFGHMDLVPISFDWADDGTCVHADPRMLLVGPSDLAPDEVDKYVATLVRWNGKSMYRSSRRAAWRQIPVAWVYTTQDMTVPFSYQKSFVEDMEKAGRPVQTFEIATGHAPHLTATAGVVDAVQHVVNS